MKKFLIFMLLFVNLQVAIKENGLTFVHGLYANAQKMDNNGNIDYYCNEGDLGLQYSPIPCDGAYVDAQKTHVLVDNGSSSGGGSFNIPSYHDDGDRHAGGGGGNTHAGYNPTNNDTFVHIPIPTNIVTEFHLPRENEILFNDSLPAVVIQQWYPNDCVPTAIAICQALLNRQLTETEMIDLLIDIEVVCKNLLGIDFSKYDGGLNNAQMEALMTELGYDFEYINTWNNSVVCGIMNSIELGYPVLAALTPEAMSIMYGAEALGGHEVIIVGYYKDRVIDAFQCLDPITGIYATHYLSEFESVGFYKFLSNINTKK